MTYNFHLSESNSKPNSSKLMWVFWLELVPALFIPFMVCHSLTPTNILNTSDLWKMVESIGIFGFVLFFLLGIPLSIFGIIMAKDMSQLRITTRVISILNLIVSGFEVLLFSLLFSFAMFGLISA